jgi:predicted nucleic acid-binding protein
MTTVELLKYVYVQLSAEVINSFDHVDGVLVARGLRAINPKASIKMQIGLPWSNHH